MNRNYHQITIQLEDLNELRDAARSLSLTDRAIQTNNVNFSNLPILFQPSMNHSNVNYIHSF